MESGEDYSFGLSSGEKKRLRGGNSAFEGREVRGGEVETQTEWKCKQVVGNRSQGEKCGCWRKINKSDKVLLFRMRRRSPNEMHRHGFPVYLHHVMIGVLRNDQMMKVVEVEFWGKIKTK